MLVQVPPVSANSPLRSASTEAFIDIADVTHRYVSDGPAALDNLSLQVTRGSTFGLLGPNGAGKSTLLALLTGILRPQSGRIVVGGHSLPDDADAIKSLSALVPQEYAFYPALTGRQNLRFFGDLYRLTPAQWRGRLDRCVEICKLSEVLDQPSERYSGGLKRRLNLAIGLLAEPQVLYLDEPTVGIDAVSRGFILEAIAQLRNTGVTIVYTSHYMEEVEALCDDLAVIDHGRLIVRERTEKLLSKQASQVLQLTFATSPSDSERAALAAWQPQFTGPLQATLEATAEQIPEVLQTLARHHLRVERLQYGISRLHDVYLRLLEERQ